MKNQENAIDILKKTMKLMISNDKKYLPMQFTKLKNKEQHEILKKEGKEI